MDKYYSSFFEYESGFKSREGYNGTSTVCDLGCPLTLIAFFMFMLSQIEKSSESGSFVLNWINFDLLSRITILCMTTLKLLISFLGGL